MKVLRFEQYTPDWWEAHRGMPSASNAARVFTSQAKASASQTQYIADLIGERYDPGYGQFEDMQTSAMRRGHEIEPEARRFYEFERDCEVEQVGLCVSDCGRFVASPDGLVGEVGGLECKAPNHATQVKYLLAGKVPAEYVPQLAWSLVVTGRKYWDFLSYAPGLPKLLIRVEPDDYTERMREAMEAFDAKYKAALARIEEMAADKHDAYEQARREDAQARAF